MDFVPRSIGAALLMVLASSVGCASPIQSSPDSKRETPVGDDDDDNGNGKTDDSSVTTGGAPSGATTTDAPDSGTVSGPPATDPSTNWTGTVAFTSFVPYGDGACRYATRFENITVDVTLRDDKVAAATVSAKDVEKLLTGCTTKPLPTPRASAEHLWTLPPQDATASTITVKATADDKLQTELTIRVGLDSDTKAWASVSWKRTDATSPNDWTVGPQYISLTKK